MNTPNIEAIGVNMLLRDVGKPHAANLKNLLCLSFGRQAIVSLGRTQAADTLHWGRIAEQSARPTPQKTRRRGCPRAPKQFLHSALLPSWQLAAGQKSRKPFTLKSLFRKSQSTPANTSNLWGRARGAFGAMPALFLSAPIRAGGAA